MAKKTIATGAAKGKEGFRGKLTDHEIALIAELYEQVAQGRMTMGQVAAGFA